MERYAIDELLEVNVNSVKKNGGAFQLEASDGTVYTASSVIFCAGKQYRTLGVPGENRFVGKGIAFCATCDAPLYRDRSVAVVGGSMRAVRFGCYLAGCPRVPLAAVQGNAGRPARGGFLPDRAAVSTFPAAEHARHGRLLHRQR